ncbi:MAG: porin [Planctomycetales bacterium]
MAIRHRNPLAVCALCAAVVFGAATGDADEPTAAGDGGSLLERLEAAEQRIQELEAGRNEPMLRPALGTTDAIDRDLRPAAFATCPVCSGAGCGACNHTGTGDLATAAACDQANGNGDGEKKPKFYVDYDDGFVIRPYDPEKTPFELQINGRMQFRYAGFQRDREFFVNRGGVVPVRNRNDFEIERGRLEFSGFMWDPKLQYYINIDADTDDNHDAKFHDFWVNYEFSKAFNLHLGKAFVPGSYDWTNGSTRTHFADRSMATTFFRPDRSLGIWATGEVAEGLHYRTMLANGFNTTDLEPDEIDDEFAYSHMMWWDAVGDVGKGYADLEWHEDPALRIGSAYTFANQNPDFDRSPTAEENFVRLSDGTRLVTTGALAPGLTVDDFDIHLLAAFFNGKYRGWSVNAEFYFRWLQDLETQEGTAPPINKLYDDGFYTDVGYMILPKKLEIIGRVSAVDGMFGDAWEYAGGFNWYINGDHSNKLTFDVSVLDGCPAENSGPNYVVGQDGILYRAQYQVAF